MERSTFNLKLRSEVERNVCAGRLTSAAFLVWYLNNFFRIELQDAIDCVCDGRNDKGIDGIYVDEDEEEICIFQSKFSPRDGMGQGDVDLRDFNGTRNWFSSRESVEQLLSSTINEELKAKLQGFTIAEKIASEYDVKYFFVTNREFDHNATEYLAVTDIEGIDITKLHDMYTYVADEDIVTEEKTLSLSNLSKIEYNLPDGTNVRVYPLKIYELLKLDGIQDRTLFNKNVRYGLGKTRVNKEIKKTILNESEHNNFFIYHNGITIISESLEENANDVKINNYTIINGCQSMLTFYENRDAISDNMYVLVKIIKLRAGSDLVDKITYYANNQNSISLKDLKSNDRVQVALQREFERLFGTRVLYKIKRGESEEGYDHIIDIDFAAQLIESLYLKNPQNTHQKSKLFSERYTAIFSRHINASKIYLSNKIYNIIEENSSSINREQVRGYRLAKFFFTLLVGEILRADNIGIRLIDNPSEFIFDHLSVIDNSITRLWMLVSTDINAYIDEYTEDHNGFFDYKNVFKNGDFVRTMCRRLITDHQKALVRHPEDSFENIYNTMLAET